MSSAGRSWLIGHFSMLRYGRIACYITRDIRGVGAVARDKKEKARPEQAATSFIEVAIRLAALALLLYWTLILVQPFLSIAIWSAVLTVALYPIFEWTSRMLGGHRRIAAALITLLSLLIIVGPATWLALGLADSLRLISERLDLANLTIPPT